jgi:glutathione S-transferase
MHELTGIAFSHYVEKARWALDRFAVPYKDQRVLPLLHFAAVLRVHGGRMGKQDKASTRFSTPVLRTDDGTVLSDSAEIVRYVSRRFAPPGHDLYAQPGAGELEQHFHDQLGPYTRRAAYGALFERPALLTQMVRHNVDIVQATLFRALSPLAIRALQRALAITPDGVQRAVERTLREFDGVSTRLADGRPFLLGDQFSAADLAFACLAAPAVLPAEYSAWMPPAEALPEPIALRTLQLRETPAGAFVLRMFRDERKRVVA